MQTKPQKIRQRHTRRPPTASPPPAPPRPVSGPVTVSRFNERAANLVDSSARPPLVVSDHVVHEEQRRTLHVSCSFHCSQNLSLFHSALSLRHLHHDKPVGGVCCGHAHVAFDIGMRGRAQADDHVEGSDRGRRCAVLSDHLETPHALSAYARLTGMQGQRVTLASRRMPQQQSEHSRQPQRQRVHGQSRARASEQQPVHGTTQRCLTPIPSSAGGSEEEAEEGARLRAGRVQRASWREVP
eukprot:3906728-Rhodomonas_salina.1